MGRVGLEAEGVWIRLVEVRMGVAAAVTSITGSKDGSTFRGTGLACWLLELFGRIDGGRRAPRWPWKIRRQKGTLLDDSPALAGLNEPSTEEGAGAGAGGDTPGVGDLA